MTIGFSRSNLNYLLNFWVSVVLSVLSLTVLSCSTKQSKNNLITRSDSIQLIQKIFNDPPLIYRLKSEFKEKQMKLVIGKNVHPDFQLLFDNKAIVIVPYDSTTDEMRAKFPRKFFGQIPMFNVQPGGKIKISMVFRGSGLTCLYTLQRDAVNWLIINRQFGRI